MTVTAGSALPSPVSTVQTHKRAKIGAAFSVLGAASILAQGLLNIMARQNVGRLVVLEGPRLLGIVTRGDLMRTIQTRQELLA